MWVSITFIIWDRVLLNTPELKINNDNGHVHRTSISELAQSLPSNRHAEYTGHAKTSEHAHRTF